MSQVTQPRFQVSTRTPSRTMVVVAALLALAGTVAIVLVLSLSGSSDSTAPSGPATRSDGGPDEVVIATSVGSRPVSSPNEAGIAAAISHASPAAVDPSTLSPISDDRPILHSQGGHPNP